jgi:hypothetical protein
MPVQLRIENRDVDRSFECRLCSLTAYDETGQRNCNPGAVLGTSMNWVAPQLCELCYDAIKILFRNDSRKDNTLSCIRIVEESEKKTIDFLESRTSIAEVMLKAAGQRSLAPDCQGVQVKALEGSDVIEIQGAFTFYPDEDYPGAKDIVGHHVTGKYKGTQGVFVYALPGKAVATAKRWPVMCLSF